jgi:translation elongation factor EF-G
LNKRKACNIEEELNEFSNIFVIRANMPLAESLGFDEEIRSATQSKADY